VFLRKRVKVDEKFDFGESQDTFIIVYTGTLNLDERTVTFVKALGKTTNIKLVIAGKVEEEFIRFIQKNQLDSRVKYIGYVNHREIPKILKSADALWYVFRYHFASTKLYEYLRAGKPILFSAPQISEATRVATKSENIIFLPEDANRLAELLERIKNLKGLTFKPPKEYSRVYQTEQLAKLLDKLVK